MSGHSHWAGIKHKKGLEDQKRGKIFSKFAKQITIAAKDGGENPETNPKLRQTIEEARSFNMPRENIERAIKRAAGGAEGQLEEIFYEALGPRGIGLIVEGITDNKNRTLLEIKQILQKHGGKLAATGSVKWLFEKRGIITINHEEQINMPKEELEMKVIEGGAEDIRWDKDKKNMDVLTTPEKFEETKKNIEGAGIKIESANISLLAKEEVEILEKDKEAINKLFEELDDNDAVQNIYSNLKS